MKKLIVVLVVLVMVGMGLIVLKKYEIKARYQGTQRIYDISESETITVIIPAKVLNGMVEEVSVFEESTPPPQSEG